MYLAGQFSALTDGVDDYLRIASTPRPVTTYALIRIPAHVGTGLPIVSFGTNYPYIGRSDVASCVAYYSTAVVTTKCNSAPLSDLYFHLVRVKDDGLNVEVAVSDPTLTSWTQVATGTDANARAATPGAYAFGAFGAGTSPTVNDLAALVQLNAWGSAGDDANMLGYCRNQIVNVMAMPRTSFVGTRITQSDAQPRPYPSAHEGRSGDTLGQLSQRLVGAWGGSGGVTIGSADDPGAGNRGAIETLCTTQGLTGLELIIHIGTNDASTGAVSTTIYQQMCQRIMAVAGVGPGSVSKIFLCTITGRTDGGGTPQTRITTFNAAAPALVTTLQGLSVPAVLCDLAAAFNTGTMLGSDGLHPNLLGAQTNAATIYATLVASGHSATTNRLVCCGDSITEGGANLFGATAQYRPHLAKLLAAGGY